MKRLRETHNPTVVYLLTIASLAALSSCENLYTITTTIDIGSSAAGGGVTDQQADYSWLQPSNTTTISISQETTTYLPASTTVPTTQELLNPEETGFSNWYAQPSHRREEEEDDDDDEPEGPADHTIPYSVHEDARDVPTRPKYVAPGLWAKPPADKDIPLDFVPTKLHAQVRGTHTVKRLPQREAVESAETEEEKFNAHRLRKVVTNSKVNTVYTEEGYEDSAYDHAGHVRDADFHKGFARKLHDQKNNKHGSWSGKRKKGKHRNLVPEEFKEYDEDYQDHLEESRKREETADDEHNLIGYGKNPWEGSEIDPQLVVASGIRELEKDVEEDAEEAERSARVYQREQESKPLSEDDGSESEETSDEDDLKDEENKPVTSKKKKKKFKSRDEKADKGKETSRKSEQKKKLRKGSQGKTVFSVDGTSSEVDSEAPESPQGFIARPLNSQVYSIDQTTLRYFAPASSATYQRLDEPTTTINYSQLFWNFFKAKPTVEPIVHVSNSTTLEPELEEHTPVAVATIGSQGPYLLVTREETSTLPSTFFGTSDFHPQRLFSDRSHFEPNSAGSGTHRSSGQSDDIAYIDGVDNVIATSTVATFGSEVRPLLLQPLQSTSIENTEYSSTTLLDDAASTPAVMTLNFTEEAYARIDDYEANPFLKPILDNSNIAVTRNKFKYRVLVRPTPKKSQKPTTSHQPPHQKTPLSETSQEEDENKRIRDELNTKYKKILDYITSKHKIKPFASNKKTVLPGDLTLLKPPIPHQRATYPIFPSRPIADHSSASVESESPRESGNWRDSSRHQHRSRPTDPLYRFNSSPFVLVHPVQLTYRKNMLPVTKLLPPLPLPPPVITGTHVTYRSGGQRNDYLSHVPGKPQHQQQSDKPLKLFPLIPNASWRTRSRRKRSGEGESHDDCDGDSDGAPCVKVVANNAESNRDEADRRNYSSSRAAGSRVEIEP